MQWETVIGLEIHAQLATQSKIFSGSSTAFGAAPNTQASLVDLAMPGTLPVLNEEAVRMACLFGLAIDARIDRQNVFARKNYFYPDLPKGYQTSQMDHPIVGKGHLDITLEDGTSKRIGITRAHLEEDAGKSLHEDFQGMSGIDLNRAGTPLLEIVSEPDIRSAKEAVAYVKAIHALVRYLGICDGNMAEGSLRCDCNVSVRPKGQAEFGTRAEIKNVNSFRFIEKAINHEIQRQIELIEDGGKVVQETRLYDPNKDETRSMRGKEEANDYRYFPCPDLLPVVIEPEYLAKLREQLPELPVQKRERFESQYGLSAYDASVLSASREMADYFEKVQGICGDAKLAANWVMVELGSLLNKDGLETEQSPVSAEQLGGMILRIKDNTISGKIAKMVFEAMANGEGSADQIIEAKGLKQVTDSGAIEKMLDEVLAANAEQVEQYRAADEAKRGKMFGFFVGQAMKASKGKANPQQVNELLKKKARSVSQSQTPGSPGVFLSARSLLSMPTPSAAARLALAVLPLFLAGCSSLAGSGSADTGEASYYGSRHAGLRTASGERYNPNAMTAAHRTLPFGTRVRVTNLDNRRSVVVRINDRGPFRRGRIIDVSRKAAEGLGMIRSGVAPVRIESLD